MATNSNWKFSIYRLIVTAGIFILALPLLLERDLFSFIHIPSVVGFFGLTFLLLLGTFEADFLRFIPASLATLCFIPRQPNPKFAEIARFASRYAIGVAAIYTLVGLIGMVRNLSTPDQIGAGIAVALMPALYGIILSEAFFALAYKAFSGRSDQESSKPLSAKGIALLMAVVGLILVRFALGIVSLTEIR